MPRTILSRICGGALGAGFVLSAALFAAPALADAEPSAGLTEAQALPPLPAAPKLELPKPDQESLEKLDQRLTALENNDPILRDRAARELLEVKPRMTPSLSFRLHQIADRADKEAMKRLFTRIREESRDQTPPSVNGSAPSDDYLTMVLGRFRADSKDYRDLVQVIAISRMLSQIGSVEATRVLIDVYVRFGEFLRIHTQRELTSLGERAVPALLEATKHPAPKISSWAKRQLDVMGRAVAGEAIQTADPAVLADVLRAYGRLKDPDSARIIVSFAQSERARVREAARQAIVLMGEVSHWQLRDSYEDTVGKRAPRDWSWDRTARELFAEFDRMRSATTLRAFDQGRAAQARGNLEEMRIAFDEVLARNPTFENTEELAKGYLAYAERPDAEPSKAELALFRAARLSVDPTQKQAIESSLLTQQAIIESSQGLADRRLLDRALKLDPQNARALSTLRQLESGEPRESGQRTRTLAASLILIGALAAVFVLLRRGRGAPAQG